MAGDTFSIIVPEESSNLIENPSFEKNITDFWTSQDNGAGATFTRSVGVTYYGIGSARVAAGNAICQLNSDVISVADGETIYAQCMSRSTLATKDQLQLRDTTNATTRDTDVGTLANTWTKLSCSWENDTGLAANISVRLQNLAADSTTIVHSDGVQAEIDSSAETTYIDGDQPGCEWNGEAHNSTSTRSALSYDGGVSNEFATDLNLYIGQVMGLSAPPINVTTQPYAMTPGDFYNGKRKQSRDFVLSGHVTGTSMLDLHDNYKALIDAFGVEETRPIRMQYTGGTSSKWWNALYLAGLQGRRGFSLTQEAVTIRMKAPDPNMYQVNDTNDVLDANDTATLRYITRRRRSTGQWDDMGLTADPDGGDTVSSICAASDGLVYIGGGFTGWDGEAGWDYGVIYNPVTDTFSRWGGASDFDDVIYDIIEGPDGTIYVCGKFADCGDANGDGIVSWNGSAWVSLGTPGMGDANEILKMAFDSSGNLYVVGHFENLAGDADFDGFAYWNGTAWATLGLPAVVDPEYLNGIAIDIDDNIYVCGDCDNIGGVTYDNLAMWNDSTSAWEDVGVGLNGTTQCVTIGLDGKTLYIGGTFTDAGGQANADKIAIWTGEQFLPLGSPPNNTVYQIRIDPNNNIWVCGAFTSVGGLTADRVAIWNGASWILPDINLPGAPEVYDIEFANPDPMVDDNFDIYIGWNTTGTGYFAGDATVNNPGNADAWPTFYISRSGGTSATLYQIRNETTGKTLYFNHNFLDGETLTIQLTPDGSLISSNFQINTIKSKIYTILGSQRRKSLLANSDDGTFVLRKGDNLITCFVNIAGAPTVTANCLHKAVFTGYDD